MEYPKVRVPDAHVYKVHILNASNEVSHILVFNRDHPYANEEILYDTVTNLADDAQLVYSKQQLLHDDPIRIIKKKILMDIVANTDLRVSYEELYLFAYTENMRPTNTLFDELLVAQQSHQPELVDKTTLLHTTVQRILGDSAFPPNTIRTQYSADEFETLIAGATQSLYVCTPIGPKSASADFHANPYSSPITHTFVEYLENTLLMNVVGGGVRENTLYLCMAEPVLRFHNTSNNALIDMYFKLLNPYHVRSIPDLVRVRPTLLKNTNALLNPDVFTLYDSVQLLHDVYYTRKSETAYTQRGIQSFQLQLTPDFQNALPLEIIFKSIHASRLVPFIKYNPGERRENIYRIYFEKLSKNGKKVPFLKDRLIMKLSREMGRSGQISLYIQQPFVETATAIYLHFELSGRVTIQCELKRPLVETEIDALLNEAVNPVIQSINRFLEQTGFHIPKYTSMRAFNVSVDKVRYIMKTPITNRVLLRNVGCIYSVFNVFRDDVEAGTADMRFKRVDNYQEMDAKTIFISENRDNIPLAIEGLMLNFSMSADDAKLEIAQFFDTHADALGNIVDNPGFPVSMRLEKSLETTQLVFEVVQINNLNYLDTVFVYLDSLIRITQNIRSSAFSRDVIGRICKSKKTQDVSHIKNVVVSTQPDTAVPAIAVVPKKTMADFDLLKELEINVDENGLVIPDDLGEDEPDTHDVLNGVFFDDDDDFDGEMVSENEIQQFMSNTDKYVEHKTPKSPENDQNEQRLNKVDDGKTVAANTTVAPPKSLLDTLSDTLGFTNTKTDSSPEGVFFDDEEDENEDTGENENEKRLNETKTVAPPTSSPSIIQNGEEKSKTPKSSPSPENGNTKSSSSPEGVFFDEDDIEMEDLEGGDGDEDEDMFDPDPEDVANALTDDGLAGTSLNNPNPFLQRLTTREPELYLTSKQGKYKSYSTNCQPINRQPVILTDAEKRKIDTEHPGSYHHAIKYGTDPKNKYWYVCPRYWCFLTNTSMSKSEVDSGKCGGIIPENATKIPKGSYVYEFKTEDHFDEKGNYVDHYPGFGLKEDVHPKGYCLPCCFKNWNKGKQKERKEQCLGMVADKDGSYGAEDANASVPATHTVSDTRVPKRQNMYVISFDTYPLPETRWGYLPISAQMYVGTNYAQAVDKNNNALIQPNKTVMLRYGVEQPRGQSFLGMFADVYAYTQQMTTLPRVAEFKQQLVQILTLDMFLKLHNGSLVSAFRHPATNLDVYQYRETQFYQKYPPTTDENKQVLISTLGSYESFLAYLKDNTQPIDHTYLWDLFCFTTKLNLILLEVRNNDVTDKIELVCPTNMYSNATFDPRRDSVIVLKHDEFYEPVYQYRMVDGVVDVQKTVSEKTMNPTLKQLLLNIKYTSKKYCSPLPSVPKVYKFRPPILLDELLQHIRAVSSVAKAQVVNYQGQVIGVVTEDASNNTNDIDQLPSSTVAPTLVGGADVVAINDHAIMLPCYPSAPRHDIPVVEMDEPAIWKSYEYTRETLTKLSKTSQLKIPCRPVMKVVDEGLIVGVITETYQFVQINPPEENVVMDNLHTLNNSNFNTVDRVLATQRNPDKARVDVLKNIQLETAFYSAFRSTMRKLIAMRGNVRAELINAIENKTILYRQKVEAVVGLLKSLGRGRVTFEEIDRDVLMELNDITDCNPDMETNTYCIVRDDGTPQLILPKSHLLSGKSNDMVYYTRLADELVRYDRVKMFMFQPKMYLNINHTDYQVNTDEFMLIQSALNSDYFDDLDVLNDNTHITNIAYQFAHPSNSQTYSNQMLPLSEQQFIDVLAPTEGAEALCIKSASIPIVGNTMSMWVRSFPRQAREIVFQNTPTCSFHVMMTILNDKFGKMIDVNAVKELLWNGYNKLMGAYEHKLMEILRNQGKLRLMVPVIKGRVTFDAMLFSEQYYLSDLDIWVLATTYNLPIVLFTSTFLKGVQGKINWLKLGGGAGDKYYFVRSTITAERDNVAEYHLVKPAFQLNELGEFSAQYQSALQGSREYAKHVKSLVQMLESVEFIRGK